MRGFVTEGNGGMESWKNERRKKEGVEDYINKWIVNQREWCDGILGEWKIAREKMWKIT